MNKGEIIAVICWAVIVIVSVLLAALFDPYWIVLALISGAPLMVVLAILA